MFTEVITEGVGTMPPLPQLTLGNYRPPDVAVLMELHRGWHQGGDNRCPSTLPSRLRAA